jgi:ATP-binding cassette subfamily B protein
LSQSSSGNAFDLSLIRRILGFAKPYKSLLFGTLFTTIFISFLAPVRPYLIQYTYDHFILIPDPDNLLFYTVLMIGLLILETVVQFFVSYSSNLLGQSVIRDMRTKVYSHILHFRLKYFDDTPVGTLVTRSINDIETIASVFSEGLLQIMGDFLKIFSVLTVMLWIDPMLTLISLIPVPILIIATNIFKNGIKKSFQDVRNQVANLNAFVQEHITGMSVVQIFNREEKEYNSFVKINHDHRVAHIKSIWYYSVFFPVVEVLTAISTGLTVWWGANDVIRSVDSDASPGKIISFILFIYMLYRPVRQLADRFNTLQMGIVSAERIFKILDLKEHIPDTGTKELKDIQGKIRFENVWFAYNQEDFVLKNLNFSVREGEKLALVGATGSGKSSIINILNRFYDINRGQIYIDDHEIRSLSIECLRKNISVVLQDVFLFSGTILENITLHNPDISEVDVIEAAGFVGAHEFISKLPGGYHFNVRERGAMLSVGQRQLISFIRAYVHKPRILILDEATSNIDSESEQLIQTATEKITEGRTSIIIAHRLSTIRNADKIIVLDKGEILELGSHNELMETEGRYRRLFELQYT